ncbi:MAG: hypothetical protein IPL12_22885 [Bacteroidetes bacterium]|nr:hypothetical protein [Bacteroidota bacterium]
MIKLQVREQMQVYRKAEAILHVGQQEQKIVFAGGWYLGYDGSILPSNNVDIYDITTGVWTKPHHRKRDNITAGCNW